MSSNLIHIPLGPIGHLPPPTPQPTAIYFGIRPGVGKEEVFTYLQEGLYRTFLQAPWLNGKVHAQTPDTPGWRPGQLEIRYDPNVDNTNRPRCYQFHCNELKSTLSYEELKAKGFPLDAFEDESLTWVSYNLRGGNFDAGVEVVAAQVNFIAGGCLLVISVHHAACDAIGMGIVLKLWADHCQTLSKQSQGSLSFVHMISEKNWDRTLLDRIWAKESRERTVADVAPGTWQLIGLDPPGPDSDGLVPPVRTRLTPREQPMRSRIFYMTGTVFEELRKESNLELGGTDLSRNDVVLALLWRTLIRARLAARKHQNAESTTEIDSLAELQIVHNGRPGFSQTLLPFYMGNCIFYHHPTVPMQALVSPDSSIAFVAQAIRTSSRNINHENILDAYMILQKMRDWTRLQPLRHITVKDTWMMSSMIKTSMDAINFGDHIFTNGGCPEDFRPLMSNRNRSQVPACFVLPIKKNGQVEVILSTFEDEWPFILEDKEFGRYTSLLA